MFDALKEKIKRNHRRLYPSGRAFRMAPGSVFEKLTDSQAEWEAEFQQDTEAILNTLLPDNPNFTADDASRLEFLYGLIVDPPGVSLDDRKLAILRKMNHPGDIRARQSSDYLENSIQQAGFDLYVHDNPLNLNINQVLQLSGTFANLGQQNLGTFNLGSSQSVYSQFFSTINLGQANLGTFNLGQSNFYNQKVINNIDYKRDIFLGTPEWNRVFYVGAQDFGDFGTAPEVRRNELRQLILRLKPVRTQAYLLINYT